MWAKCNQGRDGKEVSGTTALRHMRCSCQHLITQWWLQCQHFKQNPSWRGAAVEKTQGESKQVRQGKWKTVINRHIVVTISFVHQNQQDVLLLQQSQLKGNPTKLNRAQGKCKRFKCKVRPGVQRYTVLLQAPCSLLFFWPYGLDLGTFGRVSLSFVPLTRPCW